MRSACMSTSISIPTLSHTDLIACLRVPTSVTPVLLVEFGGRVQCSVVAQPAAVLLTRRVRAGADDAPRADNVH